MIRHYDNTSMLDLNLYQFQIQHGVLTQDYVMHTHDFYEIVVILGGSGEHVIGEQRYLLRRGDVFVIRGDLPHGFQRVERLELINLLYNQSIFDRQAEELRLFPGFEELFLLEPELRYESAFQDMLNLCEDDLEDLLHMADFLSRQLNAQEKGFETIVRMTFLTLIAFLSTKYTAMSVGSREMRMVACALRYMQEHLAENIRAEHIA